MSLIKTEFTKTFTKFMDSTIIPQADLLRLKDNPDMAKLYTEMTEEEFLVTPEANNYEKVDALRFDDDLLEKIKKKYSFFKNVYDVILLFGDRYADEVNMSWDQRPRFIVVLEETKETVPKYHIFGLPILGDRLIKEKTTYNASIFLPKTFKEMDPLPSYWR